MVLDSIGIMVAVELVTHYKLWQLALTATSCLVAQCSLHCSVAFISHVDDNNYDEGLLT